LNKSTDATKAKSESSYKSLWLQRNSPSLIKNRIVGNSLRSSLILDNKSENQKSLNSIISRKTELIINGIMKKVLQDNNEKLLVS